MPVKLGDLKVYKSRPEREETMDNGTVLKLQGGMVRSQSGEVIPYQETRGWLCLEPDQFKALLLECFGDDGK